ncbi:hypothetical protein Gpo141_00014152, partial [Globisporangium polare]
MEAKLLVSSGLFAEPRFRRLFKARHREMSCMEIRTKTLTAALVEDPATAFTVYKLQIRSSVRRADAGEWTLAKRYSEFFRFRERLLRQIRKWEDELDAELRSSKNKQFALISNALRKPITPNFPRKHMRCDTEAIVRERRAGLQDFLRKLLDAYADLSVYVYNSSSSGMRVSSSEDKQKKNGKDAKEARVYAHLKEIFLDMERFLDIPAVQKEVERVQVAAILSLEDVDGEDADEVEDQPENDDGSSDNSSGLVCCICLTGPADLKSKEARDKMVKLPCAHKFHEDCVIDWFNASTTCPLCRRNS